MAVIICAILIASSIGLVYALGENGLFKSKKLDLSDWDNGAIKNFANYEYLGAGVIDDNAKVSTNNGAIIYFSSNMDDSVKKAKLMGITNNGACEKVKIDDKSGNTVEHDVNLTFLCKIGRLSFVCFSDSDEFIDIYGHNSHMISPFGVSSNDAYSNPYYSGERVDTHLNDGVKDGQLFGIDNKTGHIYYFNNILKKLMDENHFNHPSGSLSIIKYSKDNDIYATFSYHGYDENNVETLEVSVLKMTVGENSITMEKIMDNEQLQNAGSLTYIDAYGNILFERANQKINVFNTTSYMFTDIGDTLPGSVDKSQVSYEWWGNGVVYARAPDYCGYLDNESKFVEIEDHGAIGKKLTKSSENVFYEYKIESEVLYYNKITVDSEKRWLYTVEERVVGDNDSLGNVNTAYNHSIFYKDHIYSYVDDTFYDYNYSTGVLDAIDCSLTINEMKFNDELNIVEIDCIIKSTMRTAKGYIDPAKTGKEKLVMEEYELKYGPSRIYIISPIN